MSSVHSQRGRRLSVAMIARDEAEVIGESLESVRALADEMVVVDTGSRDATAAVAGRLGARILNAPWRDDFSAARNAAIEAATGDWILWLDAGERLTAEAATAVRDFVDHQADATRAYLLTIEHETSGGAIERVDRIRLMPRRDGLRFSHRVRETLVPALAALDMTVDRLECHLPRGARERNPALREMRAHRNLRLVELETSDRGPRADMWLVRAEALGTLGRTAAAAQAYKQALDIAERGSKEMLEAYYGLLAALDRPNMASQAQLTLCLEALAVYPLDAQLLCAMGGYLKAQDQLTLAERSYRLAVEHGVIEHEIWHRADVPFIALACLAACLEAQNRQDEAAELLREATARDDTAPLVRRHFLDLCVRQARTDEALALVNTLGLDDGRRARLRTAVRGACQAARGAWSMAHSYLRAAYQEGCRDVLCMRWLVTSLFALGEARAAEPVLREWAAIDPTSGELANFAAALISESETHAQSQPFAPATGEMFRVDAASANPVRAAHAGQSPVAPRHSEPSRGVER